MTEKLKILVVDGDESLRRLIAKVASELPGIEVVDSAANGRIALAKMRRLNVDLVLLDLDMPDMSGAETIKKIRDNNQDVDILVESAAIEKKVDNIVETLELGAIDYIPKPVIANENSIREFRLRLMTVTGLLGARRNFRRAYQTEKRPVYVYKNTDVNTAGVDISNETSHVENRKPSISIVPARIEIVAIAVSTGGPNALAEVIPRLPSNMRVPILVVQHMPSSFTTSLASSLNAKSILTVREAIDGEEVLPNIVYIAPGGRHMVVRKLTTIDNMPPKRQIRLTDDPPENSVRPSADVLFRSLAEAYESNVLPVIMTGMGNDGLKGIETLKAKGCYCLTQSADTCTVYGMPRSVDEAALSDEKVALNRLAERIVSLIHFKKYKF